MCYGTAIGSEKCSKAAGTWILRPPDDDPRFPYDFLSFHLTYSTFKYFRHHTNAVYALTGCPLIRTCGHEFSCVSISFRAQTRADINFGNGCNRQTTFDHWSTPITERSTFVVFQRYRMSLSTAVR